MRLRRARHEQLQTFFEATRPSCSQVEIHCFFLLRALVFRFKRAVSVSLFFFFPSFFFFFFKGITLIDDCFSSRNVHCNGYLYFLHILYCRFLTIGYLRYFKREKIYGHVYTSYTKINNVHIYINIHMYYKKYVRFNSY